MLWGLYKTAINNKLDLQRTIKVAPIEANPSGRYVELQALMCEREGMVAENMQRERLQQCMAHCEESFQELAKKIRSIMRLDSDDFERDPSQEGNDPTSQE